MLNTYFFFVSFTTCTKNTYFIHYWMLMIRIESTLQKAFRHYTLGIGIHAWRPNISG